MSERTDDSDDDDVFVGAVTRNNIGALQRDDPELRAPIEYSERRGSAVPRAFARSLTPFAVRESVLYKETFGGTNSKWLLVIPANLRF